MVDICWLSFPVQDLFVTCHIILDYILDIFDIILWAWVLFKPYGKGLYFCLIGSQPGGVQAICSNHTSLCVLPMSVQFWKPLKCCLHMYTTQRPIWMEQWIETTVQFSRSRVFCLGPDPSMCTLWVSSEIQKQLSQVLPSLWSPQYFLDPCGSTLYSSSQKAGA